MSAIETHPCGHCGSPVQTVPTESILAKDVIPHEWGFACQTRSGELFVNEIYSQTWSKDGLGIVFRCNCWSYQYPADAELALVRIVPEDDTEELRLERRQAHEAFLQSRPTPPEVCPECQAILTP